MSPSGAPATVSNRPHANQVASAILDRATENDAARAKRRAATGFEIHLGRSWLLNTGNASNKPPKKDALRVRSTRNATRFTNPLIH
jgi:hypothetical protein